jgi:lysozyme family protein
MADFDKALAKTLLNEGGFADRRSTTGEVVNRGITHWTLRALNRMIGFGTGPTTPRSEPASNREVARVRNIPMAETQAIYRQQYWTPVGCDNIADQALAEKVFDIGVNCGTGTAAKMLQRAVNRQGWPSGIVEDGKIGPKSIAAINALDPVALLERLREEAARHYNKLGGPDLNAWLDRLARG